MKSILSVVVLLASCTGLEDRNELFPDRIEAGLSETRILLEDGHSVWKKGDDISVFFGSSENELWRYDGEDGARSGAIVASEGRKRNVAEGTVFAVYPYSSATSLEGGRVSTLLPTDQPYCGSSYGTALLAAKAQKASDGLLFTYASAMVRLRLTGCNAPVSSVALEAVGGERIAGRCTLTFGESGVTAGGGDSGRVTVTGPAAVDGGAEFMFSILPADFSRGCRFTVSYADGTGQEIVRSTAFSVAAGEVETITASGILSDDKIRLSMCFSDGATMQWPFCGTYNSGDYKFTVGKVVGPWYLAGYPDRYPFYMFQAATGSYQFRITNGGGLRIGGTVGDFIRLPGIDGYRLASIALVTSYSTSFKVVGPDGKEVPDSALSMEKEFGYLPLKGTEAGKAYDMVLTDSNNIGIYTMTLVYERV